MRPLQAFGSSRNACDRRKFKPKRLGKWRVDIYPFSPDSNCSKSTKPIGLVAIPVESAGDLRGHVLIQHASAAEIAPTLLRRRNRQVARAGRAMLNLARRGEAKTLLRSLMGFHLGHGKTLAYQTALCSEGRIRPKIAAPQQLATSTTRQNALHSDHRKPRILGAEVQI